MKRDPTEVKIKRINLLIRKAILNGFMSVDIR